MKIRKANLEMDTVSVYIHENKKEGADISRYSLY